MYCDPQHSHKTNSKSRSSPAEAAAAAMEAMEFGDEQSQLVLIDSPTTYTPQPQSQSQSQSPQIIWGMDCFDSFPPGYRFCPFDDELVYHYLRKKIFNEPLPPNKIHDVQLYQHNPDDLADTFKVIGEKEWYFFTPRERKYRNGNRPNRAAGDGYWKATGADKKIQFKFDTIGFRKALVFYLGKPPRGEKTNWIMHEYRLNAPPRSKTNINDMRLDDWVLCKIYKKDKSKKVTSDKSESLLQVESDNNDCAKNNCEYDSIEDFNKISSTTSCDAIINACSPNYGMPSAYYGPLYLNFNYGTQPNLSPPLWDPACGQL